MHLFLSTRGESNLQWGWWDWTCGGQACLGILSGARDGPWKEASKCFFLSLLRTTHHLTSILRYVNDNQILDIMAVWFWLWATMGAKRENPVRQGCFAGFEFCDGGWRAEWSKTQALTAKRCLFCEFGFNLLKVGAFWLATAEAFRCSEIHRNISVSKAVLAEWRWKRCFHYGASHCGPWSEHIFETQILKCPDIKIIAWDDHPTLSMFGRLRKNPTKAFDCFSIWWTGKFGWVQRMYSCRSNFRVLTWNRPIEPAISIRIMFWVPGRYLTLDRWDVWTWKAVLAWVVTSEAGEISGNQKLWPLSGRALQPFSGQGQLVSRQKQCGPFLLGFFIS